MLKLSKGIQTVNLRELIRRVQYLNKPGEADFFQTMKIGEVGTNIPDPRANSEK